MSLTQEQVKHIANLSRLKLSEEDILKYSNDLNSIVNYIDILSGISDDKLKDINISDTKLELPLREDEVYKSVISSREDLLGCSTKKIINHSISINNIM